MRDMNHPIASTCLNYKHESMTPPADLEQIMYVFYGYVVLSMDASEIQLRYGLEVNCWSNTPKNLIKALNQLEEERARFHAACHPR